MNPDGEVKISPRSIRCGHLSGEAAHRRQRQLHPRHGVDPINEQAYRGYVELDHERGNPVVSGDVAADLAAPWPTPRRAILYAQPGADFSTIGLTPSHAVVSTLTLVLPHDPGVWPISKAPVVIEMCGKGDIARANAFQVLYDLSGSPGPDADEALEAWRTWMIKLGALL